MGLPLTDHVSPAAKIRRYTSGPLDRRAASMKLASSRPQLASHPLRFVLHGRSLAAIGIASVHTLREFRGLGLAQRMIRWIEPFERERGARLSVLFCDIDPRYYARLGYTSSAHHILVGLPRQTSIEHASPTTAGNGRPPALRKLSPRRISRFAELYDSDHGQRALTVERTTDYWQHLAERVPEAERFWLVSPARDRCGYAWLRIVGGDLLIDDHAVRDGSDTQSDRFCCACPSSSSPPSVAWPGLAAGCRRFPWPTRLFDVAPTHGRDHDV